jgi:predicted acyl esterase
MGPVDPFGVVFGNPPNPERFPGWADTLRGSPGCMADNHQGYMPTNAHTPYFDARDYQALGADVTASVFYIQGFLDTAVKPDNFGAWFDAVPTTKKAWLGHWYHMYPTAQGGGRDDMFLTLHRWFDHTLKGIDNGIDKEPMVDVMDSDGGWRHEHAWPPADVAPLVYQLDASGALVTAGASAGAVEIGAPTDAATVALASNPIVGPTSPLASGAPFETETLGKPLRIAGSPWLDLTLASDRPTGAIVAKLFDGERLVSQGAYNLLYAGGLAEPEPLSAGEPVTVSFAMYPTDWLAMEGSALTLVLMAQDPEGWFESDASMAILTLEAGETATLTLPTIERADDAVFLRSCGWPLENVVDGCFQDLKDLGMEFPE